MTSPVFTCNTYLHLHETALIASGLWPMRIFERYLPAALRFLGVLLDRIWILILGLNSLHLAICQVKTVYDKWGTGIDYLYVHGQEYLVAHTIVVLTVLFRLQHKNIAQLLHVMNNNLRPRSAPGLTYTSMEKSFNLSQRLSLIYIVFCVVGTFHHCISPILSGTRQLPVDTWYPFDYTQSPYYEIVYLLQMMGTLQSGMVYSSIIVLSFSITTLMVAQYDLLYCSIHNLIYTAMLVRGDQRYLAYLRRKQLDWKERNQDWIQYVYSEESMEDLPVVSNIPAPELDAVQYEVDELWRSWDSEISTLLNDCTKFHMSIIRIVKQSEESLRYILGAALIHFVLLLCLLVYALSRHLVLDNTLIHILSYTALTYALACLMCYPGHILVYQVGTEIEIIWG